MDALAKKHADTLTVLVVNAWDEPADLIDGYLKRNKVAHATVLYDGEPAARLYGIRGIPESVLIDSAGRIAKARDAFDPNRPDEFQRLLEKATGAK